MGYFDGVTDAYFKTDKDGNTVFFPWGIVGGKGYILPEDRKFKFRNSIKKQMQISLPIAILMTMILKWWAIFLVLPLYLGVYAIWINKLTEGLEASTEKLSLNESSINSAQSHNLTALWVFEIFSILFVSAGLFIIITSPKDWFIGASSILFFGFCGYFIGRMIKNKKAQKSA